MASWWWWICCKYLASPEASMSHLVHLLVNSFKLQAHYLMKSPLGVTNLNYFEFWPKALLLLLWPSKICIQRSESFYKQQHKHRTDISTLLAGPRSRQTRKGNTRGVTWGICFILFWRLWGFFWRKRIYGDCVVEARGEMTGVSSFFPPCRF